MERKFIKSGIPGFDTVLGGGFPEGSIVTVGGPTGAGKSTLAMQFLYNGAVQFGDVGLCISIEESRKDLFFHMDGYDWDISKVEREKKFVLLDYPIHEVDQILNQYSAIQEIITTTGVRRVVIDSIMPIALYFKNDDERKTGFLKLIENIRKWNVTTLIVSEDVKATGLEVLPDTQYGIETFTDGWIHLFYHYDEKKMERSRYLEVLKMKGIQHSTKPYPVTLGRSGFSLVKAGAASPPPPSVEKSAPEKKTPAAKGLKKLAAPPPSILSKLAAAKLKKK